MVLLIKEWLLHPGYEDVAIFEVSCWCGSETAVTKDVRGDLESGGADEIGTVPGGFCDFSVNPQRDGKQRPRIDRIE